MKHTLHILELLSRKVVECTEGNRALAKEIQVQAFRNSLFLRVPLRWVYNIKLCLTYFFVIQINRVANIRTLPDRFIYTFFALDKSIDGYKFLGGIC